MIRPLTIANKTFPVNLVQGPLAGYSSAAFRVLAWEQSHPAFTCTEMISANALKQQALAKQQRYLAKDPQEGPVCFQIFGSDPGHIAYATKVVTERGADLIDLNCGCPVKKVRKQGAGSSLLTQPALLYKLLVAMKQNTQLPVAAKVRVEGNSPDRFHHELLKVIQDSGIDFLVVHGRHWNQSYQAPCHYDQIKYFVDNLKIPVIGNGNIFCVESLRKILATGCAGAMLGRAGIGQPWIINKLRLQAQGLEFQAPALSEIGRLFIRHLTLLSELFQSDKFALLNARKLTGLYTQGLPNKKEFCGAVHSCESLTELKTICSHYFNLVA